MRLIKIQYLIYLIVFSTQFGCVTPLFISNDFVGIGLYSNEIIENHGDVDITSLHGFGVAYFNNRISLGYQQYTVAYFPLTIKGGEILTENIIIRTGNYAENSLNRIGVFKNETH